MGPDTLSFVDHEVPDAAAGVSSARRAGNFMITI
jgi:hypothetical protein